MLIPCKLLMTFSWYNFDLKYFDFDFDKLLFFN